MLSKLLLKSLLFVGIIILNNNLKAQDIDSLLNMSIEDLLKVKVVSTASNINEKLSEVPLNVITLDKLDLKLKGYTCLVDIFDDLPGMDINKPYGFQRSRNSWRGYRTPTGDPYIFMVDGVVFNHLWYNEATSMAAIPLSNIERVEIVYGPASSTYGADAFMGVVNVITNKNKAHEGTSANLSSFWGEKSFTGDYNVIFKKDDWGISLTSRFENCDIYHRIDNNSYEWTKTSHTKDSNLWGGLVNNSYLSGRPTIKNRAVDLRIFNKNLELGLQYYKTDMGYGMIFPNDKSLAGDQPMNEYSAYLRYSYEINKKLLSKTMLRYRRSDVSGDCNFINGINITNTGTDTVVLGGIPVAPNESARVVDYSYWGTLNTSLSYNQSFEYTLSEKFSIMAGYQYEYKDLQKAWETRHGTAYSPQILEIRNVGFLPDPIDLSKRRENRIIWENNSGYLHLKYELNKNNFLSFGSRVDNNSTYGTAFTFRGGYVFKYNKFSTKLIYGESFREPSPQTLYGEWNALGSDPELKPERSKTTEINLVYAKKNVSAVIDCYYVNNINTIITYIGGAHNLGKRNLLGLDIHLSAVISPFFVKQIKLWGIGSFILDEEEQKFDEMGHSTQMGLIGDLAQMKFYMGTSAIINKYLSFSIKGRYIGEKETVLTNPVNKVDSYFLLDCNIIISDFLFNGFGVSFQVNNILDTKYFHPGTREANAGTTPGYWEGDAWIGSAGWNNSLMPQPMRYFLVGFHISL